MNLLEYVKFTEETSAETLHSLASIGGCGAASEQGTEFCRGFRQHTQARVRDGVGKSVPHVNSNVGEHSEAHDCRISNPWKLRESALKFLIQRELETVKAP